MALRKEMRDEILAGPIVRTMVRVGGPAVLSSLLFTLYNLADAFWIGRLPTDQSSAVMAGIQISWPFIWFVISFVAGFGGAAVSALVAQHIGAGRPDEANLAINQLFSVALVAGVVLGITGFLLSSSILGLLVNDIEVVRQAAAYLKVIFLGLPTMVIPGLFYFAFSATGDTVTPLFVNGSGVILNMILDPLLVLGLAGFPRMGILGAAVATIVSQGVATVIFLVLFQRGHSGLRLDVGALRPQRTWMRRALRIGLPAAIGQSSVAFGYVVMTAVIGQLENASIALAGYGIADRIFGMLFIVTDGLSVGLTTMLGQALGAGRLRRARETVRAGLRTLMIIVVAEAVLLWLARRPLVGLFIPGQPDVIREGARFIQLFAAGMPFLSAYFAADAVYRGAGHTVPMMIVGILRLWVLRIPLSYILAFPVGWQADGVWLGMSLSNVISGLIAAGLLAGRSWQRSVVSSEV
jgi:putative MATE family efflux protein